MPIHESSVCVFNWRYGSSEMRRIFTLESIIEKYILVEAALLHGLEAIGFAPKGCAEKLRSCSRRVGEIARKVYELEKSRGHDIASLVEVLSTECAEECAPLIHFGLTSNDVIDTAWALLLRDAFKLIKVKLCNIIKKLIELSLKHCSSIMPGRTHGQYALPITLGFKFANYVYEFTRSLERIASLEERLVRGKMSGAVGTMAAWKGFGLELEKYALSYLDLKPHPISTQVAPRDGFAELGAVFAILASQFERFALEVRELSRPEIREVWEEARRIGSSAMPHKRNPVVSERICGLAKLVRGIAVSLLENIALWHERDLSNSSLERHAIPHLLLAVDQILDDMTWLLNHLALDTDTMKRHVEEYWWLMSSECLLTRMVLKGVPRMKAHSVLWRIYMESKSRDEFFKLLTSHPDIRGLIDNDDLEYCSRPENYLGHIQDLINRAHDYANKVLKEVCM